MITWGKENEESCVHVHACAAVYRAQGRPDCLDDISTKTKVKGVNRVA